MPLKILFVTATSAEADSLKNIPGIKKSPGGFISGGHEITLLETGVGSISTAWGLIKWFSSNLKPDLAVNAGIAGSFRDDIKTGDVVIPVSDCFADAGIETGKDFLTLAEAGLESRYEFPFREGVIVADNRFIAMASGILRPVRSVTVNTASGAEATIKKLISKFDPDIETMEGATFFYICTRENIPFLAVRAVSNKVEPRDISKWNIPLALGNLSVTLGKIFLMLE